MLFFLFSFLFRSVLGVTAVVSVCWAPTGWVKTPHTNFSRWSWSTSSTRPSDATQTHNGSQRLCTSTGKCVASRQPARRAVVWARATSSTLPSAVLAVRPGGDATLCSCTVTANMCAEHLYIHQNKVPLYGPLSAWCFFFYFIFFMLSYQFQVNTITSSKVIKSMLSFY